MNITSLGNILIPNLFIEKERIPQGVLDGDWVQYHQLNEVFYCQIYASHCFRLEKSIRRNKTENETIDGVKVWKAKLPIARKIVLDLGDSDEFPSTSDQIKFMCLGWIVRKDSILFNKVRVDSLFASGLSKDVIIGQKTEIVTKRCIHPVSEPYPGPLSIEESHLVDILEILSNCTESLEYLNVEVPKGILLYGPPGVGKTHTVVKICNHYHLKMFSVKQSDLVGSDTDGQQILRSLFKQAKEYYGISLIFIDEIDTIAPRRESNPQAASMVAQLLTLMDGVESRGRVVVVGATNRPNAVDAALRRPGRFDREIQLKAPNQEKRLEILTSLLKNLPVEADLEKVSSITIGYVTADLVSLVRESCMIAAKCNSSVVTDLIFMKAFQVLGTPSILRSSQISLEKLDWSSVGGMKPVKRILKQSVEWPVLHKEAFSRLGLKAPRGILLYGPPGCSKTTLAKILASQTGLAFFSLNGAAIYSSAVGESEASIRTLFNTARSCSPCIIFFDEIDALVGKRGSTSTGDTVQERILSTLLNEMDGIENAPGVLVIGATNRPDMVDSALLRPGRFDKIVYVPPPTAEERLEILKIYTKGMPLADDVELETIAKITANCTGADLKGICREAALITLRIHHQNTEQKVSQEAFIMALNERSPTVSREMLKQYEEFSNLF